MLSSTAAHPARAKAIVYQDFPARAWLWRQAPLRWFGKVDLDFCEAEYGWLEPAGSLKNPDVVARWRSRLERGLPIPPPVVCLTPHGTLYLHDGNHRYDAMQAYFGVKAASARIRVAVLVPKWDFHFRYHWYGSYGTYVLERLRPSGGRAWHQQAQSAANSDPSGALNGRIQAVVARMVLPIATTGIQAGN